MSDLAAACAQGHGGGKTVAPAWPYQHSVRKDAWLTAPFSLWRRPARFIVHPLRTIAAGVGVGGIVEAETHEESLRFIPASAAADRDAMPATLANATSNR
jgi:hypothetical protein